MGFSGQEYWDGLPFLPPGDLPDPGIKSRFPALQAFLLTFVKRLSDKDFTCNAKTQEIRVPSLCGKDPLEEEMATHSSILAWKIPWTEEPGGLQSMWVTKNQMDMTA